MGKYLNPSVRSFLISRNSKPYIDKSLLIETLNKRIDTENRYICVSRPRRFGKTMAANMITAYYERGIDSRNIFKGLKLTEQKD